MALRTPSWLQGASHPAENDRLLVSDLLATSGFVGADDFKIAPAGGMSISVAAGSAFVPGTVRANQGVYHCVNDDVLQITLTPADASYGRIDSVVLVVRDAEVEGSSNLAEVIAVAGVATSNPVPPVIPSNALLLGRVSVPAGTQALTSGNVTDTRVSRATALGGTVPCTSSTRPSNPYHGMEIYELDTGFKRIWSALNAWKVTADTGMLPTVYNPPRAYAYQTTSQVVPSNSSVYTPLRMGAVKWDTAGMHSTSVNPSRLTIKTAGFYEIKAGMYFSTADTGLRRLAIFANGDGAAFMQTYNTTAAPTILNASVEARLAAGAYVEAMLLQTAGNSLNTVVGNPAYNWISARWVAPY